jgi:hypothetical protein
MNFGRIFLLYVDYFNEIDSGVLEFSRSSYQKKIFEKNVFSLKKTTKNIFLNKNADQI